MKLIRKILEFLWRLILGFVVISILSVILFRWVPVPVTPLMVIRCVEQKMDGKKMRLSHDWVPFKEITPKLQLAVVCSEDQNYLKHFGFDWGAIQKAMKQNEEGKHIRGASTITQQTAKNVFLWPGRSYIRKGFEVWFTLLIEIFWSKERIMEVYLNSIEMGDGVYGAQAATQHWYRKDASSLTPIQAAGIAAILPNPRKYKATSSSSYINNRKTKIMRVMRQVGKIDYDK